MKLHTANKYLSSLPQVSEKGMAARFASLRESTFAALGADAAFSILLIVSGEEHSYVCRATAAALAYAGHSATLLNLDPSAPAEALVRIGQSHAGDDEVAEVVTAIRQSAIALGLTPTMIEAKLLCALALCSRKGCKNIILGFDPSRVSRAFFDIIPPSRTVALLPSEASAADSVAIVRKGVLELISAPRGEEEYRAISAVCAAVNCRHSVISRSAITSPALTYRGIEFFYKNRKYAIRGHSESMIMAALSSVLAACALERRGFKISESDVGATLPDVAVEYGCRIASYNPCVVAVICRNGTLSPQLKSDVERICSYFNKTPYVFSAHEGGGTLDATLQLCQGDEYALCIEGDAAFVQKNLNVLSEWIAHSQKNQ